MSDKVSELNMLDRSVSTGFSATTTYSTGFLLSTTSEADMISFILFIFTYHNDH
jgi:hypothetical protein